MMACITGSEALRRRGGLQNRASRMRGKFACAWHWQAVLLCRASCPLCPRNKDKIFPLFGSLCASGPELSLWALLPCLPPKNHFFARYSWGTDWPKLRSVKVVLEPHSSRGEGFWLQLLNGFLCLWLQFSPFTLKMWYQPAPYPADWQGRQRASRYCANASCRDTIFCLSSAFTEGTKKTHHTFLSFTIRLYSAFC